MAPHYEAVLLYHYVGLLCMTDKLTGCVTWWANVFTEINFYKKRTAQAEWIVTILFRECRKVLAAGTLKPYRIHELLSPIIRCPLVYFESGLLYIYIYIFIYKFFWPWLETKSGYVLCRSATLVFVSHFPLCCVVVRSILSPPVLRLRTTTHARTYTRTRTHVERYAPMHARRHAL